MSRAGHALGLRAEAAAAEMLAAKGYRVLGSRVRTPRGELDLVAEDGATLVFVEVKAFGAPRPGRHPGEAVGAAKRRRIAAAAGAYLARLGGPPRPCRFDVVSVVGSGPGTLEHLAGAFTL